jgi:Tol biopolymer transport system component
VDISPDGKQLLVLVGEGIEVERALWIVPIAGGQPLQVGKIRCHAAAWSPDGRRIAFAAQNAIYLSADQGKFIQEIQAFDATPEYLRWAPNERSLRVYLRDRKTEMSSLWDLTISDQDNAQVSSLVPLQVSLKDCWGNSMTLDGDGRSILAGGECTKERIYLLEKRHEPWSPHFDLVPTSTLIQSPEDLALDPKSKKVFALGDSAGPENSTGTQRLELLRFDARSNEFRPFLPGIAATDVDFSRDGKWIAYVRRPDQTLWISRADGSSARQVELQARFFELPRWSPDGRWLAFMALLPGKPWRIFTVSSSGGVLREASMGTDNQGAPTWSPDGKWLAHGNVECQETGTCAIHEINLSTGQEFTVPGSDGLSTARWSPDGRFIAALNPIGHEVLVFDEARQQWRKVADGVNGNDLSWSADSQYLYASRPAGNQPEILRISVSDAKVETAIDLRSFAALSGQIDTWFALAPDGSIIFSRELSANEIYSFTYSEK